MDITRVINDNNINRVFEKNVLTNNIQTVHISSINICVNKAIYIIIEESQKYLSVDRPLNKLLKSPLRIGSPYYYNWFLNIIDPFLNQFKDISFKAALIKWIEDKSIHTIHKITFKQLITMIMTIIENHRQKENMKQRLIVELKESVNLCFTGIINRMVNALVGFVDGIYIGLSVKEEIEMKISVLIKQLIDKKINKETVQEQMIEFFSQVGEKDNISDDYKEANLRALDDYDNPFEGFDRL